MKADPSGATRASATALALVLIAAALVGCGGDATGQDPPAQGVGESYGGSVAALAQCRDWNAGTEAEKQATIADIRSSLTPQSQEESGTSLSDERAYELFEHSCTEDWAQGFELYKLYARKAAFAPLAEP
ncbi:MAG: hypothetical protein AABM42_02680 [Actinomycetota bacterium]